MITDPVANFLTIIRNAASNRKETVNVTYSKLKLAIADILKKEGFLESVQIDKTAKPVARLILTLKFTGKTNNTTEPAVHSIKRISKPGRRVYVDHQRIPRPLRGNGTVIISTSSGLVTGKEAFSKHMGGEVICEVW